MILVHAEAVRSISIVVVRIYNVNIHQNVQNFHRPLIKHGGRFFSSYSQCFLIYEGYALLR